MWRCTNNDVRPVKVRAWLATIKSPVGVIGKPTRLVHQREGSGKREGDREVGVLNRTTQSTFNSGIVIVVVCNPVPVGYQLDLLHIHRFVMFYFYPE